MLHIEKIHDVSHNIHMPYDAPHDMTRSTCNKKLFDYHEMHSNEMHSNEKLSYENIESLDGKLTDVYSMNSVVINEKKYTLKEFINRYSDIYLIKYSDNRMVYSAYRDNKKRILKFIKKSILTNDNYNIFLFFKLTPNKYFSKINYIYDIEQYTVLDIEWIDGVTLNSNNLSNEMIGGIIYDIINALNFLHSHNIVHGDIKPENIIMSNKQTVIIDYDLCHYNNLNRYSKKIGTPFFLPPETKIYNILNDRADIWALGVTLFYCCLKSIKNINIYNEKKINISLYKNDIINNYNPSIYEIIKSMLTENFNERPSSKKLMKILEQHKTFDHNEYKTIDAKVLYKIN